MDYLEALERAGDRSAAFTKLLEKAVAADTDADMTAIVIELLELYGRTDAKIFEKITGERSVDQTIKDLLNGR